MRTMLFEMTPAQLKSLGFVPLSKRIRGDSTELFQIFRHADGSQHTVVWKPKFELRPHKHGEYGETYNEADLQQHGWPPPESEPVVEPETERQGELF